jgi:hypothetical protein
MVAYMHVGPLIADLNELEGLAEHVDGVRDRLEALTRTETITDRELGDARVAAAFHEFLEATGREHTSNQARAAALARATRSAAAAYRQADESFLTEVHAGGGT